MAYRLRWKRRRLLWRSWRKRRELTLAVERTNTITASDILVFSCVRNEAERLPYFLEYYRGLGVAHFFFVENDSDDGTFELLAQQPDCSVWRTTHSYKIARFGMDWLGYLQMRFGTGHWCLTLDADEIFAYPDSENRGLGDLTAWLDQRKQPAFAAQLVDLYPEGNILDATYTPGQDPREVLKYYDAWNTTHIWQPKQRNQWIQGGARARAFFNEDPRRAPTLNKLPLVKWKRHYSYVTSTHIMLPRSLNSAFDATDGLPMIGALLHTKFLPSILQRSQQEKVRNEHFENSALYQQYYDTILKNPSLWQRESKCYRGERGLIEDGIFWRTQW